MIDDSVNKFMADSNINSSSKKKDSISKLNIIVGSDASLGEKHMMMNASNVVKEGIPIILDNFDLNLDNTISALKGVSIITASNLEDPKLAVAFGKLLRDTLGPSSNRPNGRGVMEKN